jgi:hypothetical protein
LNPQLSETFSNALKFKPSIERPTIISVANAGNWKDLYPTIRRRLPNIRLDPGARYPVVFGGDEALYLKQLGVAGAAQFKQSVRQLLQDHERIFVFETQKIQCLQTNPACIGDLVTAGRSATLYFRDDVDPSIANYLRSRGAAIDWHKQSVSDDSVSVVATKLSARIMSDEFEQVAAIVTADERATLENMRTELFNLLAPEIEDRFLEGSFGAPKLREFARRKVASALLKATVSPFSTKSGKDPIDFFREELAKKFELHDLPLAYISEISPNLSFVVKSQKRFAKLRLG